MSTKHPYTKYFKQYPWLAKSTVLPGTGVCIVEVSPKQLHENPKNWRIHSSRQRSTYRAFKSKYGWLQTILFNVLTGKLVDGHMRVDEAIKSKEPVVPVIIRELSEEEENEILGTLDTIGLLAQRNTQALDSLLKATTKSKDQLKASKSDAERKLAQLRVDLQSSLSQPNPQAPALRQATTRIRRQTPETELEEDISFPETEEVEEGFTPKIHSEVFTTEIDPDVLFPGLTHMGIPELALDRIATPDLLPKRTYSGKETLPGSDLYMCYSQTWDESYEIGTLGFYTEDYRFTTLYADPGEFMEWLSNLQIQCLVGPDFTCNTAWPLVVNLFNVYKSRWCTRLWQEAGYWVVPTIQLLDDLPFSTKSKFISNTQLYVLDTLPSCCPTVAMECRLPDMSTDVPKLVSLINKTVEIVKPDCMLLYAGEEKKKYIHGDLHTTIPGTKRKIEYRYLPQTMTERRKKKKQNG